MPFGRTNAGMNLPLGSRVVIDRTNEPNRAPGELVLLVETLCLAIEARRDSLTSDYILHGSVVRGGKHSYVFAVRRVPSIKGVRAMAASLARQGAALGRRLYVCCGLSPAPT